ncbi:hypothetical protein DC522_31795 [Microvirga sp. KLBC 81]|nr:hypothetical protein DC522_31795 [Microvirga sp. KLBC 81]
MEDWYPVRLAPRDGTPVILWIEDEEAPPLFPVTVGMWEVDDISGLGNWRVFSPRFTTSLYFDRHIVGWRPLPRVYRA